LDEGEKLLRQRKWAPAEETLAAALAVAGPAEKAVLQKGLAAASNGRTFNAAMAAGNKHLEGKNYRDAREAFRRALLVEGFAGDMEARKALEKANTSLTREMRQQDYLSLLKKANALKREAMARPDSLEAWARVERAALEAAVSDYRDTGDARKLLEEARRQQYLCCLRVAQNSVAEARRRPSRSGWEKAIALSREAVKRGRERAAEATALLATAQAGLRAFLKPDVERLDASARQATRTRLIVRKGQYVKIEASGKWRLGILYGTCGPDGKFSEKNPFNVHKAKHGMLLARIEGSPKVFEVGRGISFRAPSSGPLVFFVNDKATKNNSGSLQVTVTVSDEEPRRRGSLRPVVPRGSP
jgi:hypothetical protein